MEDRRRVQRKQCVYCGRFFRPDRRVGDRQKSCSSPECRVRRKKEAQERWLGANPGYFRGRYGETKQWRELHPGYQRLWRARRREIQDKNPKKSPMASLRLVIPAKWFKGEIQDEIRLVRQCGCGFFVTGEPVRDTRHDGTPAKGQATIGSS